MVAEPEGLSAEQILAASDPMSCKNLFWEALARGDRRVALDAASRISLPAVSDSSFSFSEEDAGEGKSPYDVEVEEGALLIAMPVEPETPPNVISCWNTEKSVGTIIVNFDTMCLARMDKGKGVRDFRACS